MVVARGEGVASEGVSGLKPSSQSSMHAFYGQVSSASAVSFAVVVVVVGGGSPQKAFLV